jgi:hypothetical protein
MKIKIRPDAARVLQNNDWHQVNDWLAGALIAGQRICSRGMVPAATRVWRGYGGRRHPATPVSTARAR